MIRCRERESKRNKRTFTFLKVVTRLKENTLQREKKKLQELETLLEKSNSQIKQLESAMGEPENYAVPAKFASLEKEYSVLKKQVGEINTQLESVVERVLTLEDELG
jgi:chromosome segregation ATPase